MPYQRVLSHVDEANTEISHRLVFEPSDEKPLPPGGGFFCFVHRDYEFRRDWIRAVYQFDDSDILISIFKD